MLKVCSKCNIKKSLELFRAIKGKLKSECKECEAKRLKEWRLSNPDKRKEQIMRDYKSGGLERAKKFKDTHKEKLRLERAEKRKKLGEEIKIIPSHLTCSICKQNKISSMFYKDKGTTTGYKQVCKKCTAKPNREAQNKKLKEWRKNNPDKTRAYKLNRRLKIKLEHESLEYMKTLINDPCSYCGSPGPSTIDHIVPISKDGDSNWTNLTAACKSCNSQKQAKDFLKFIIENRF